MARGDKELNQKKSRTREGPQVARTPYIMFHVLFTSPQAVDLAFYRPLYIWFIRVNEAHHLNFSAYFHLLYHIVNVLQIYLAKSKASVARAPDKRAKACVGRICVASAAVEFSARPDNDDAA